MEGKNKKKITSIFDSSRETAFLRSCGLAQQGVPPHSDPSVLGTSSSLPSETAPRSDSCNSDSIINSGYENDLVESHAVRFVSPPESPVPVDSVPLENSANPRLESPAKKLKIPLRDVVKAIVMNSRSKEEEEDREIEKKRSCMQVLVKKGFNFPPI